MVSPLAGTAQDGGSNKTGAIVEMMSCNWMKPQIDGWLMLQTEAIMRCPCPCPFDGDVQHE